MNFFKSKKYNTWAAAAVGILMLGGGCTREYIENVNPVCFEQDVLPIFQSNCTQSGCHNSVTREQGYDLSNYEGILKGVEPGSYKRSEIYKIITTPFGIMPPSPYDRLSDEQITTIALWIDQGAEKTTCETSSCDTTNVSLSGTVMPIFETYCNGCHGGSAPQGDIDFSNYTGIIKTVNDGSLVGSIQHAVGYSAMPQGSGKLSACNISKIEKWISLGAKND